ncbi:MAG: 4Fe-4S binding protein [Candidatus Saccharicenans sp.]|nr:4Fe-4S binding protein [Candidatus Saccharicenans sp.]
MSTKGIRSNLYLVATFLLLAFPSLTRAQQQGPGPAAAPNFFDFLLRPKFITMLVIGAVALALLLTNRMNSRLKVLILLVSTFLYGLSANLGLKIFAGFSMHPSPICAATKSILYGFRMPMIVTLAVIIFLTLVGPKLFCSYVCPVGAIQELIAMLADKLQIRRRKPSFRLSQTFRVLIFIAFIFLSWTAIIHTVANNRIVALSLYDYINAFHGYEINLQPTLLDNLFHFLPFILTLVFAFFTYRPFCYFVCPIGLITNVIEQIGLFRVVKRKEACTDCQTCLAKAPCPAVAEILKEAVLVADCFACTVCTGNCPGSQLKFGVKRQKPDNPTA